MDNRILDSILYGASDISDKIKASVELYTKDVMSKFDLLSANRENNLIKAKSFKNASGPGADTIKGFNNISALINLDADSLGNDLTSMLNNLYDKNKKYFTIIKDYEIMPILIPQINRVLMFLVNECISPDIQTDRSFNIKYTGSDSDGNNVKAINRSIEKIRTELSLDSLLKKVYLNRYKLGREYYRVIDYNKTFEYVNSKLTNMPLNEVSGLNDNPIKYLDNYFGNLKCKINDISLNESVTVNKNDIETESKSIEIKLQDLNIEIIKSPIVEVVDMVKDEVLDETAKQYSLNTILSSNSLNINETASPENIMKMVNNLKEKKLNRCAISRLDPSRVFKLKSSTGKIIGYFYMEDNLLSKGKTIINYSQMLKDRLIKSKATNLDTAYQSVEKAITKDLSEKLINTFDPNLGITKIEDIDLLHDYLINNDMLKGNKRITFYYKDDIIDLSREDESILTNAVLFTKLYSMLMLNNITTKVLRGRGRQIHTINMGASTSVHRYLENAIASLTMPETRLGTMTGSFEQLLNPLYSASDIVIPSEDGNDQFIKTDLIEGQNVDMDVDILKFLLNSIISSFGLDSAVLDVTNGNIDFAKTLTMLSLQIVNSVKSEQNDLWAPWKQLVLQALSISDDTLKAAVENDDIEVEFFKPKSLILTLSNDELNAAKTFAENLADNIPELDDNDILRRFFVYRIVKDKVSLDWDNIEKILGDIDITVLKAEQREKLMKLLQEAKDKINNTPTTNEDEMVE